MTATSPSKTQEIATTQESKRSSEQFEVKTATVDSKEPTLVSKYISFFQLNLDFTAFRKTVDEIGHAEIKKIAKAMLNACELKTIAFNKDIQNPLMAEKLGEELIELENITINSAAAIKHAGGDITSLHRAEAVIDHIKKAYVAAKAKLTPSAVSLASETKTPTTAHRWQEYRLRLEQQLLMEDSSLTKAFHQALTAISQKGLKDHALPKSVLICYAQPDQQQPQDQHLSPWLPKFLSHLRDHLRAAGLTTQLDTKDMPMGGNRYEYMKAAETADFVLLIGTETLLREHEKGLSPVCAQLVDINRKRAKDREARKYRVLPLLLSGDYQTSFPPHYELYTAIEDWKGSKTYFQHICRLVTTLYSTQEEAFKSIWETFLTATTQDQRLILEHGLNEKAVLDYLEAEKVAHQKLATQQAAASRSMLGLDSSGELKEVKRLLPAFEPKQTHIDALTDSWHLPQPNDHYFTGRVAELKKLKETFDIKQEAKSKTMILSAVSGLGGVGKTQLAIYHVHHPEQDYSLRLWFQAEIDILLHQDYLEFAQQYKLPLEEKAPRHEVIKAVKRYLSSQPNWLAVYDNAGSYQELKDFLPTELKNGHLLITTRRTEWHDTGSKLEVDVFSQTEAITYLKKVIQREDKQSEEEEKALTELVHELGYLPLALAQAGAYIKTSGILVVDYLRLYRKRAIKMLKDATLPVGSNVQPVAITWDISLKAIEVEEQKTGDTRLSLPVLQAMSYLAPDHIPRSLLERWLTESAFIKRDQSAELLLNKAVKRLSAYSMIQCHPEQKTLSVHRLVQEVVQFQLQQAKSTVPAVTFLESKGDAKSTTVTEQCLHSFLLTSLTDSSGKEFDLETQVLVDEKRQKALLPHLQALVKHHDGSSSSSTLPSADLGRLLGSIGYIFNTQLGDAGQAKPYHERSLKILEQHYGKDYWQVAGTLNNLANACGDLGDDLTKKVLLERALKINEQHYGKDHWQVAGTLSNLGNACGDLGYDLRKKALLERALKMQEQHYGKDHWRVAMTLNNLATACGDLGDAPTKKALLERALKIDEQHYGKDHWQVAMTLSNLGNACGDLGDAPTQKMLLKRALQINEQHYGKDHWQVAGTLNNLGAARGDLGDSPTQKMVLERALKIAEQHYGKDHWRVATILGNLATACGDLGDASTKKTLLERALNIKEQYYGKDHWQVAITLNNLVTAYQQLGDIATALSYACEVHRIFNASFKNPDHPHIKTAERNLQKLQRLSSQQQSPELKQTFEQTFQTKQAVSNLCQPGILTLLQQGDIETARHYFESENMNFDDSEVHAQLAEHYMTQKHFSGAIIHLEQVLSLAQQAKEPLVRLSQLHRQLACVYLCHHTTLKQTGKPVAEQQEAETLAKNHFEAGVKDLAGFKATDASFLSQQAVCYTAMVAQAVSGDVIAVRQVLESFVKTLSTPSVRPGAGDTKAAVPTGQQEQKCTTSGATEQFSAAQLSDNPHRFLAPIPSTPEVKTGSQLVSQSTAEEPTEEDELQKALALSLLLNQTPAQQNVGAPLVDASGQAQGLPLQSDGTRETDEESASEEEQLKLALQMSLGQ